MCASAWTGAIMRCTSSWGFIYFFLPLCFQKLGSLSVSASVTPSCQRAISHLSCIVKCQWKHKCPTHCKPPPSPPAPRPPERTVSPSSVERRCSLFMFSRSNWKLWLFPGRLSHFDEARSLQFPSLGAALCSNEDPLNVFQIQMNDSLTSILKLKWVSTCLPLSVFVLMLFKEERPWLCVGYY